MTELRKRMKNIRDDVVIPKFNSHIYKYINGYWYIDIYTGGERSRLSLKTKDDLEAKRSYNEIKKIWDNFTKERE